MNYKNIRQKYPDFKYKNFEYELSGNDFVAKFLFEVGEYKFQPKISFKGIPKERFNTLEKNTLDNLVFHLGLAEIASYWKAFASQNIIIEAGTFDPEQTSWWKDLLIKGMGQYFFENQIDFTSPDFIKLTSIGKIKYAIGKNTKASGILIPVGGGKDSAVSLEILKDVKRPGVLLINPTDAAIEVTKTSGIKEKIIIDREIDKTLINLNNEGFLNGHTPFSSIVAFVSVTAAYLFGYSEVALSNERSSDEENTTYLNTKINHQYSKTFEFENNFKNYISNYVETDVNYFSFLRPLYEIQIAKMFSKMKKYHAFFRSCNVGQKTNSWCRNCSKCLSTFILLKPFLNENELTQIFGENLLDKPSLKEILSELIDEEKVKPFECVGTRHELKVALDLVKDDKILSSWNADNNSPEKYNEILKKYV